MAETQVANIEALVKERIAPGLKEHYLEELDLYNRIERGRGQRTNMRGIRIPNRVQRNASFGAGGEDMVLPVAGRSKYLEFKVFPTTLYAGWRVSNLAIDNCKNNEDALIDILANEIEAASTGLRSKINDCIPLDGTGEIARVKSVSGTTVTCESTAAGGNMFGNIKILPDANLSFYDPVGQAYRTTPTVSVVSAEPDPALNTFTVDAISAGVAAGDRVCYSGSYNRYPHGFDALINNGSGMLQGQSRGAHPGYRSITFDARNADPTVAMFNKVRALLKFRSKMADKTTLVSAIGVKTKYEEQGHELSRFQRSGTGGTMKLDFGNVQHGPMGSGWEDYTVIQPHTVWGVDFDEFNKYELKPIGALDVRGQTTWLGINSSSQRVDAVEGWCGARFDFGTELPLAHFRINNVATADQPLAQLAF